MLYIFTVSAYTLFQNMSIHQPLAYTKAFRLLTQIFFFESTRKACLSFIEEQKQYIQGLHSRKHCPRRAYHLLKTLLGYYSQNYSLGKRIRASPAVRPPRRRKRAVWGCAGDKLRAGGFGIQPSPPRSPQAPNSTQLSAQKRPNICVNRPIFSAVQHVSA